MQRQVLFARAGHVCSASGPEQLQFHELENWFGAVGDLGFGLIGVV